MLGAFLGDIIGSVFESTPTKEYDFPLFNDKCAYTDDSVLAAAVAKWALSDKTFALETLEYHLLAFIKSFPNVAYGATFHDWAFHPDKLQDFDSRKHLQTRQAYHSCGNGAAMRVPAIGWVGRTLEETMHIAKLSAEVTHNHPEGVKGAQATAVAVFLARTGHSKAEIKTFIGERFGYVFPSWTDLCQHYTFDATCQGTVPPAIMAFLESCDFESAIRNAVSLGGDADTLACITGAIAEAYYKNIPEEMVDFAIDHLPTELFDVLRTLSDTAYAECFHKYVSPRMVGRTIPSFCFD